MSSFEHSRTKIFNVGQHPFKHDPADITYFNNAVGGSVTNMQQAMDWLFAVLYPNQKAQVATPGDLPLVGNTINDTRIVADDGDGNSASYRWFQIDGELTPSWHKMYDMDWSSDSILAAWQDQTQALYVIKYGRDDTDELGNVIAGDTAGQSIYGGLSANTNLTLFANNGDGSGPATGFVQVGDHFRPLVDDTLTLGTPGKRWTNLYSVIGSLGDITITDGSISSSSASIDFGTNDLTGIGDITAESITALSTASALAAGTTIGDVTISDGHISSGSDQIDFGDDDLITTGFANIGQILISDDTISSSSGSIDFLLNDLINIDLVDAQTVVGDIGRFGVGTDFVEITSGSIDYANGTVLNLSSAGGFNVSSTAGVLTSEVDIVGQGDITADGLVAAGTELRIVSGFNQFSIVENSGNFDITSSGFVSLFGIGFAIGTNAYPAFDGAYDLGQSGSYWGNLWLSGAINVPGGVQIFSNVLGSLRNSNIRSDTNPAQDGDSLFWSTADQCWYADHPDSEIMHSELSGIAADDHTQYALLAGRAGGQTLYGGTSSGASLVLDSTSNITKGRIVSNSNFEPGVSNSFDLGRVAYKWRNVYTTGEFFGFRAENQSTISEPSASIGNVGRVYFNTTSKKLRVDIGGSWVDVGGGTKVEVVDSVSWNGSTTSHVYSSLGVPDATKLLWQFRRSSGEIIYPTMTVVAGSVTVSFSIAPPAGIYTLIGV